MIILSIDYGTKIIGLALAESLIKNSHPLNSIYINKKTNSYWEKLNKIIKNWKPKIIILGYPTNSCGKKQKITKKVKNFKKELKKRYSIPIIFQDERFSTQEAKNYIHINKKKKNCIHSQSAVVILNSWFENKNLKNKKI